MTLFVLAIFLLSALVGCLNQPEEADYSIEPAEAGWKWLINNYHGYRIKYPEDWEDWPMNEGNESPDWLYISEPFVVIQSSLGFPVPIGSGHFGVETITPEVMKECLRGKGVNRYDRQSFAKNEINHSRNWAYNENFELLEYKSISLDGVPSTLIIYTFHRVIPSRETDPYEGKPTQMRLHIFSEEKGGKVYHINYTASRPLDRADRITENLPTVMEMIKSFEFI
mgnify:CR=1 FL=1